MYQWNETSVYTDESGILYECNNGQFVCIPGQVKRVKKGRDYIIVRLNNKEYSYSRIVYEAYFRHTIPEGYCVHLKDGNALNSNPGNLICVSRKELGQLTGHKRSSNKRYVYDHDTGILYSSISSAARQIGYHPMTIARICQGKVKNPEYNLSFYNNFSLT